MAGCVQLTKVSSTLPTSQGADLAGAYSGALFLYHEANWSISTPPGWDASPSQDYPEH